MIDTALEYRPGDPVRVRVRHREQAVTVTDDGAALGRAGAPPRSRDAAGRIAAEFAVNVSRRGVLSLPVVRVGPGEDAIVARIAGASRAFYQELLELP